MIGRRALLLGCVVAGSATAQEVRRWRIAILYPQTAQREPHQVEVELVALGYVDGSTAAIERRWAEGRFERFPALARELVETRPDVIVASTTAAALALKRATATIPIVVLSSGDAVGTGLAQSLARPGGNVTGNSFLGPELAVKQIELMRELAPGIARLAFVANAAQPPEPIFHDHMREAARPFAIAVEFVDTRGPQDFVHIVARVQALGAQGAVFAPGGYSDRANDRAALLAAIAPLRLPAIFFRREYVDAGALLSYGASFAAMNAQAARYVDRILRGDNPAELPILQPTSFELVLNLGAARRLGITVPPLLLARADEVIE